MIRLLTERPESTTQFVERFRDVDDPYVTERIYAVAYGVAMRSHDPVAVGSLATKVFEQLFADGSPPPHILLRDYARGVVERALFLGADLDIDEDLIRPPYSSAWPKIPSEAEVEGLVADGGDPSDDGEKNGWARKRIKYSVMHDDFARYVIGTNSSLTHWLSLRLDEAPWAPPDVRMKSMLPEMNKSERVVWGEYEEAEEGLRSAELMKLLQGMTALREEKGAEEDIDLDVHLASVRRTVDIAFEKLQSSMRPEVWSRVEPIIRERGKSPSGEPPRFDLRSIQRYVLWRVFDLGWTIERFGEFDRFAPMPLTDESHKAERIGKKYQWIAYHEILAHVSDNFQYWGRHIEGEDSQVYMGPWEGSLRNIDPSFTPMARNRGEASPDHPGGWWVASASYDRWDKDLSHRDWISRDTDTPDIKAILTVGKPGDKTRWITIQTDLGWEQPVPPDVEAGDIDRRSLWVLCRGFFVRDGEGQQFLEWAEGVNFLGRWMPEQEAVYRMFLGEYGWAPAFHYFDRPYYGACGWTNPGHDCPVSVRPASLRYVNEGRGFDCSADEAVLALLSADSGPINRLECRCVIEALVAATCGLAKDEFNQVLWNCDQPTGNLKDNQFTAQMDQTGFWRVDKNMDPELRHTVLTLIAFHDLQQKIDAAGGDRDAGIDAFLNQNDGEGWMLPETLRLADYGLGHDERAKHHQPVAGRLGPRFYDCHLHARNLLGKEGYRQLLAEIETEKNDTYPQQTPDTEADENLTPSLPRQSRLFE